MCGGIEARDAQKSYKVYFPSPKAAIPVLSKDGIDLGWVRWGRRKGEPGGTPQGGWAKLDTVDRGGWDKYHPQHVLGLVERYMEKDSERTSHWFDVGQGFALECLLVGEGDDQRVYVVTTSPPPEYAWIHDRWPLLAAIP